MVFDSGSLSKYKEQELAEIRRKRRRQRRSRIILVSLISILLFFIISPIRQSTGLRHSTRLPQNTGIHDGTGVSDSNLLDESADSEVGESEEEGGEYSQTVQAVLDQSEFNRQWLEAHATGVEAGLYLAFEKLILGNMLEEGPGAVAETAGDGSFLTRLWFQLRSILLRLGFFVAASLRVWIMAAVLGLVAGARHFRVYNEPDLLGLTGNGRLFFSGVLAPLRFEGDSKAPSLFVPGLACPRKAPEKELSRSSLLRELIRFGVANETNRDLASVIVAHAGMPAFVAGEGEEKQLEDFTGDPGLGLHTEGVLRCVMELHEAFASGLPGTEWEESIERRNRPLGRDDFERLLKGYLGRVLQEDKRRDIASISRSELATLVLAMEAGKVLVYKSENGRWSRSSSFPHLSARAVLHSSSGLGAEYTYEQRERLRRSLLYASRYNSFGMVRFPVDLDGPTRACRQWTELLMASPHHLPTVADEIELFGVMSEMNEKFTNILMEEVNSLSHFDEAEVYTSGTNLLLVPLRKIIGLFQSVTVPDGVRRLEELVSRVSQRQSLQEMSAEGRGEDETQNTPFRILKPLTFPEMKSLSDTHSIPMDMLKDWSALRVVLSSYSWLARRVGNSSVPDSSLVMVALRLQNLTSETEEVKLIGKEGFVPIRGTRLRERFGTGWQSRFILADAVAMAETREDLDRLIGLGSRAFADMFEQDGEG